MVKGEEFNPLSNRIINVVGGTASITIIVLILYLLKIIPESVSLAIGLFVSLPIVYSFVFGVILNKPNFSSVVRHYSFAVYILLALILFMIILRPSSIVEGVRYSFHFILGSIIATIGYFTYAMSYRIVSKQTDKYRWRALISFGISFVFTFTIAFLLKHFNIFDLI